MDFLPRPNSRKGNLTVGSYGVNQVHDVHARDFRNENLSALHSLETIDNEFYAFIKGYPEPSHTFIRDCNHPVVALLYEQGYSASSTTNNIPVPSAAEYRPSNSGVSVTLSE